MPRRQCGGQWTRWTGRELTSGANYRLWGLDGAWRQAGSIICSETPDAVPDKEVTYRDHDGRLPIDVKQRPSPSQIVYYLLLDPNPFTLHPTMASIPAHQYVNSQAVFDLLERQFILGEDVLVELTKAFLEEFKVGLENYNHPMAMM